MELEDIILGEISQTRKKILYVLTHMWKVEKRKKVLVGT